ncbi:MAG: hypothetical protein IPK26_20490 [Planctomycetes bacterium]|nr:hypothetical protein [Planctomycetota bacterium]
MLDRASSFAEPAVIALLQTKFVPLVLDEWYEVRRQDAAGELYRKIVFQRDGMSRDRTTQGLYIATPDGTLVQGWNNRNPGKLERLLAAASSVPRPEATAPAGDVPANVDPRFARTPPAGGLVADVYTRVLAADWPAECSEHDRILRAAIGRDHLWIQADEVSQLVAGRWPDSLTHRLARFHLIDNTRGEPPMWRDSEVTTARVALARRGDGTWSITGTAELASKAADRSFRAQLAGELRAHAGAITTLDLVASGEFRGHGTYTQNGAPPGPFTLGVAFRLAVPGAAAVPPQGARDLRDYLGR